MVLDTNESLHVSKVLRLHLGDQVQLTDGLGSKAIGTITSGAKKNVTLEVIDISVQNEECPYKFELAIAPTKNMDRFEMILEKCTELGIKRFHPIISYHSERRKLNLERCNKIILSAMKQSQKSWLPEILEPIKFDDFIKMCSVKHRFLAHCNVDSKRTSLKDLIENQPTVLCIGPEGDFSNDEISLAENNGFISAHLGKERLRTETAAMFAHSIFQAFNSL